MEKNTLCINADMDWKMLRRNHILMEINVIKLKRAEYKDTPKGENMMLQTLSLQQHKLLHSSLYSPQQPYFCAWLTTLGHAPNKTMDDTLGPRVSPPRSGHHCGSRHAQVQI